MRKGNCRREDKIELKGPFGSALGLLKFGIMYRRGEGRRALEKVASWPCGWLWPFALKYSHDITFRFFPFDFPYLKLSITLSWKLRWLYGTKGGWR